ncbi:MAG TPA: competence/damage-inducible protein A [Bacteroidales bacterium]|nr:competence/damage-inducible protein A [Bacteroidales bacterium]HQI69674.1 competence/damage-inducible protein A [Bacteroidales bacterium]
MTASVISIGDELLIGQTVNTNASFIAAELNLAGIQVRSILTIADDKDEISNALQLASRQSGIVIITGGLGPTNDDITKNTLCEYFGSTLILHKPSLENIRKLFYQRGIRITTVNRNQAMVPHNCTVIKNTLGTAPGMWFQKDNIHYFSLPGVPFEMKALMTGGIIPLLAKLNISAPIIHKTILTTGIGESALAELISGWENKLPSHIKLAYLPEPGIVKLRLSCYHAGSVETKKAFNAEVKKLKKLIPDLIFGYNDDTLAAVTGKLLLEKHASIATAESCTGGLIAHQITAVPGASGYFKGSVIAYDNDIKSKVLGVNKKLIEKHGAVSEEVVIAMAQNLKKIMGTDYALAVSGIAGPAGGTPEKPVGTVWLACSTPEKTLTQKLSLGNDRGRNITRASLAALNLLRKQL